jgi:hypothetical protein
MFHINRALRAQGRQMGTADVGMQRSERLSENDFIRRAAPRWRKRQPHGAELTARRRAVTARLPTNGTPLGWALTAIEVTNNQKCADVVDYLVSIGAPGE